jgi:ZIP family zinc transporter
LAIGILVFLLWDVLAHAWEPVDVALGDQNLASAAGNGAVLAAGLGLGLLSLVYFDRWVIGRGPRRPVPASVPVPDPASVPASVLVPASAVASPNQPSNQASSQLSNETSNPSEKVAGRLSLMIAIGIGLHNFAEGLAIGNSAASGEIALAGLLIIGFGLHNATEGFGIVAPMAAAGLRPSWGRLALLGLIGGGPTLVGTLVGQQFTNDTVSIAFLALAAGSILYVVIELLGVAARAAKKELTTWGVLIGLLAGFLTDAIVTAGGA